MNKHVQDMTKGNELALVVWFTLPMFLGNLFQQFYNMVDSVVVGNYVGKTALAAVGATGSLMYLYFSVCFGFATGASVLMSQYFGHGDEDRVKDIIGNTIYLIFGVGILVGALAMALSRPILIWLNTPDEIFAQTLTYLRIASGGILFTCVYNGIGAMMRALGDSKTPLIFLIIACLLNVAGDLFFVLVCHWGVAGVAIATILAQFLSACGCIVYAVLKNPYFRLTRENLRPNMEIWKKSIRVGIPLGFQGGLIAFSCIVLQAVINRFGTDVIAAFSVTCRIDQLVQQPFSSLCAAMATFSGQNLGAGKVPRVRRAYRKISALVVAYGVLMFVVILLFGNNLVNLFVTDTTVIAIGGRAARINAAFYIPLGMIFIPRGVMNGAGDAGFALISGMIEVVGRLGFALWLTAIPALGYWAIWYTTGLTWLITGIVCMGRYLQGKWARISLVG